MVFLDCQWPSGSRSARFECVYLQCLFVLRGRGIPVPVPHLLHDDEPLESRLRFYPSRLCPSELGAGVINGTLLRGCLIPERDEGARVKNRAISPIQFLNSHFYMDPPRKPNYLLFSQVAQCVRGSCSQHPTGRKAAVHPYDTTFSARHVQEQSGLHLQWTGRRSSSTQEGRGPVQHPLPAPAPLSSITQQAQGCDASTGTCRTRAAVSRHATRPNEFSFTPLGPSADARSRVPHPPAPRCEPEGRGRRGHGRRSCTCRRTCS